jgi:hypothetical protein
MTAAEKREVRERASPEVWRERVERWKSSGLRAKEFAAAETLSPRSLSWWQCNVATDEQAAQVIAACERALAWLIVEPRRDAPVEPGGRLQVPLVGRRTKPFGRVGHLLHLACEQVEPHLDAGIPRPEAAATKVSAGRAHGARVSGRTTESTHDVVAVRALLRERTTRLVHLRGVEDARLDSRDERAQPELGQDGRDDEETTVAAAQVKGKATLWMACKMVVREPIGLGVQDIPADANDVASIPGEFVPRSSRPCDRCGPLARSSSESSMMRPPNSSIRRRPSLSQQESSNFGDIP